MGEQRGVYADYRPSRLVLPEAGEHPTHLVESAAMASIAAPRPQYVPNLPERTVISAEQLAAAQAAITKKLARWNLDDMTDLDYVGDGLFLNLIAKF